MQKGWEHHAVHAAVWQRHLRIWTREYAGTREGSVCVRRTGIEKRERVCDCVCVCVAVFWLASLCLCVCWKLWVLRAPRGPLPLPGPPVTFLQATMEFPPTPFLIMQNLSFTPEAQRKKASSGLTGTGTRKTPHLFYLLLLLMEELSQPVMPELRGRKFPWNLDLRSLLPLSPVMAEIWICDSDPASVHVGSTSPGA